MTTNTETSPQETKSAPDQNVTQQSNPHLKPISGVEALRRLTRFLEVVVRFREEYFDMKRDHELVEQVDGFQYIAWDNRWEFAKLETFARSLAIRACNDDQLLRFDPFEYAHPTARNASCLAEDLRLLHSNLFEFCQYLNCTIGCVVSEPEQSVEDYPELAALRRRVTEVSSFAQDYLDAN